MGVAKSPLNLQFPCQLIFPLARDIPCAGKIYPKNPYHTGVFPHLICVCVSCKFVICDLWWPRYEKRFVVTSRHKFLAHQRQNHKCLPTSAHELVPPWMTPSSWTLRFLTCEDDYYNWWFTHGRAALKIQAWVLEEYLEGGVLSPLNIIIYYGHHLSTMYAILATICDGGQAILWKHK